MITNHCRLVLPAVFATLLALATGCELLRIDKPGKIITVNQIVRYPRGAGEIEKEIPTFSGQSIWINSNPFLHSKWIEDVELVPNVDNPAFCDLKLKLDRRGALIWMQLSVGMARQPLAFVIDGIYYRSFVINEQTDENQQEVVVRGPFDKVTAESLREHAKANYRYYQSGEESLSIPMLDKK